MVYFFPIASAFLLRGPVRTVQRQKAGDFRKEEGLIKGNK